MIVVVREESDDLFDGCNVAVFMYMEEDRVIGCPMFNIVVVVMMIVASCSKVSHVDLRFVVWKPTKDGIFRRNVPTRSIQQHQGPI